MLKEKFKESELDITQKQCLWRNVYFNKDGTNGYGYKLHKSREAAEAGARETVDGILSGTITGTNTNGVKNTKDSFSWHMQMPVLGEQ